MGKVWFITGVSKGLGLALSTYVLEQGHRVAATSRNPQKLIESARASGNADFLALKVDLTNEKSIANAVSKTNEHFGNIDVLVNNAGYG